MSWLLIIGFMIHPLPLNDATNDVQAARWKMIRACDYGHR